MLFSRSLTALLAAGCLAVAAPYARAADEAGPEDPRAKLKAQVEKILKLMRENEAALLEASTAGGAAPKGPDVKVPDVPPAPGSPETPPPGTPPPSGQGSDGANGGAAGGSSGSPGTSGADARKRLEEIIKGQQQGASRIPEELAELVRMIPT
jgi:hypothetical protein